MLCESLNMTRWTMMPMAVKSANSASIKGRPSGRPACFRPPAARRLRPQCAILAAAAAKQRKLPRLAGPRLRLGRCDRLHFEPPCQLLVVPSDSVHRLARACVVVAISLGQDFFGTLSQISADDTN